MSKKMKTQADRFTATEARTFAKRILAETLFENVKAKKFFGGWSIDIDGGEGACYGRTIRSVESAENIIRIFANE